MQAFCHSTPVRLFLIFADLCWEKKKQLLKELQVLEADQLSLNLTGDLLEESQSEASRLRQRVEELVRDNEALKSSSFAASLCMGGPGQTDTQSRSHRLGVDDQFHFHILILVYYDIVLLQCCNRIAYLD